ncbi:MAG TPA: HAD-IC family P-type ATPase [Chloroflexota bacterium]|nr:HAD-IC family P-type ATPase [Chloroflexota bacterium]
MSSTRVRRYRLTMSIESSLPPESMAASEGTRTGVPTSGLSSKEAARRLVSFGPNVVVPKQRSHGLRRWLQMMAYAMVILLVLAALIYAALGAVKDAMSIALVPILAVDVLLEGRGERTLDKLRQLTEPKVTALRDGSWASLAVELLVPGDVIRVQEGDILPADCRLLQGSDVIADESALTGESVPVPDKARVTAAVTGADAFARIRPAEKLALVQHLKALGHTVAMTGDGINDGPALRAADIGVAMGLRGTEVAREAATMVLLDDNFSTIVAAVREGRRILLNVRRAFGYLVAFHIPILLAAIAAPLAGLPLLLEPIQLVWLELVVHPVSSLAFEGDEPSPEIMRQPPRQRDAPLIENNRLLLSVVCGLGSFVVVWLGYTWFSAHGWPEALARNLAFTALVLGQVGLVLAERSEGRFRMAAGNGNRRVPVLLGLTVLSTFLPAIPGAPAFLHLQPLSPREWLLAAVLALATGLWAELVHVVGAVVRRWRPVLPTGAADRP